MQLLTPTPPSRLTSLRPVLLLALCATASSSLFGQTDGTWTRNNTPTTLWELNTNWSGSQIADGVGSTANFTAVQGGVSRTVNLDSIERTVGVFNLLNQHSTATNAQSFTFGSINGRTLTFNNGASAAQLNISNGPSTSAGTNTFSLGLRLGSSLDIANNRTLATNTLTLSGAISASSAGLKTLSNQGTSPATTTISGIISDGSGQVSVRQNSETSWLDLTGANTYTGGTRIEQGTLRITSDGNLGAASGAVTLNGGTLLINDSMIANIARGFVFDSLGGTLDSTKFLNLDGIVSGSGLFTKTGTNVLSLNNEANTHSGNINVQDGTLRIRRGDGSLGAAGNSVTLAAGTTFRVSNFSDTSVAELAAGRTFTLSSGNVNFLSDTNNPMSSLITGSGGLTKLGPANLELKNANTYAGGTIVNEGTLLANNTTGSATGSGAVIVNNGGTLGGSGIISGATTIGSGANLNPGNSPGLLTFNSTLSLAGTVTFEINGTDRGVTHDGINIGSLLSYGGDMVIDLGVSTVDDHTYNLFQIGGGHSGNFASVTLTGVYGESSLTFDSGVWSGGSLTFVSFNQNTGDLSISSLIPEPSTYASLFGLSALAWSALRRRQRTA